MAAAGAGVDRSFVEAAVRDIIREGILDSVEDSRVKMENMDNSVVDTVKGKDEEVRDITNQGNIEDDTAVRDTILAGVEATVEDSRVRCLERLEVDTGRIAELEAEILEARLAVEAAEKLLQDKQRMLQTCRQQLAAAETQAGAENISRQGGTILNWFIPLLFTHV